LLQEQKEPPPVAHLHLQPSPPFKFRPGPDGACCGACSGKEPHEKKKREQAQGKEKEKENAQRKEQKGEYEPDERRCEGYDEHGRQQNQKKRK